MLYYFSELSSKRVVTETGVRLGELTDMVFLVAEIALITKLVVKTKTKNQLMVPVEFVKQIGQTKIVVASSYAAVELVDNELYVTKNLLDKQIIDVGGNKVVRVNDVVIQDKQDKRGLVYYLAGVDVGWRGILRWLKLEKVAYPLYAALGRQSEPHFLSWADIQLLELARGRVKLKKKQEKLAKIRPEDLADYLERTTVANVAKIVDVLDEEFAADVVGELNVSYQRVLFKKFAPERAARLLNRVESDEAVDILLAVGSKKREEILKTMAEKEKGKLTKLLKLAKTPIGGLIKSEFLTVNPEETVSKLTDKIRQMLTGEYLVDYVYVVNESGQLVGWLKMVELVVSSGDTQIFKLMEPNVALVYVTTPKEIAIKKMLRYRLMALPVIDETKKMVGVVTFDDLAATLISKL